MANPDDEFLVTNEDLDDAVALAARSLRKIAGKGGRGGRYVRTPEGAEFYGQPIGTLITADIVAAAERRNGKKAPKNSLAYNPVSSGRSSAATGSRQSAIGSHLKNGPHPVEPTKTPSVAGVKKPAAPGAQGKPGATDKPNFGKIPLKPAKAPAVPEMENYDLDGTPIDVPKGSRVIRRTNSDVAYAQAPDGGIHAYTSKGEMDLSGNKEAIKKVTELFDADLASIPSFREESPVPKDSSKDRISGDLNEIHADMDSAIQEMGLTPGQRARFESLRDRLTGVDKSEEERAALETEAGVDPARPETTAPGNKVRPKAGDKADVDSLNNAPAGSSVRSENPIDGGIERYTKRDDGLWYSRGDKNGYSAEELADLDPEFSNVPEGTPDGDAPADASSVAGTPEADAPEGDFEPVEFDQKSINAARKRADESPLWEKIADLDPNNDEITLDLTPEEMQEFVDNSEGDKNLADMRDQMVQALRARKPVAKKDEAQKDTPKTQADEGGGGKPPTEERSPAPKPSEEPEDDPTEEPVEDLREAFDRAGELDPNDVEEMSFEDLEDLRNQVGVLAVPTTKGVKELNAQNAKRAERYADDPEVQTHLANIEASKEEWQKQISRNALSRRLSSLERAENPPVIAADPNKPKRAKGWEAPPAKKAPEAAAVPGPLGDSIPKGEERRKRLLEILGKKNTEGTHRVDDTSELDNAKEGDVFAIGENKYVITAEGKVKSLTTNNISEKDNFRKIAENGKLWKLENENSKIPEAATLESDPEQAWVDAQRRRNLYNKKITELLNGRLPDDLDDAERKKHDAYLEKRNEARDAAVAATKHMDDLDAAEAPDEAPAEKPKGRKGGKKRPVMEGIEEGVDRGNPILDLPEGDGQGPTPDAGFVPNREERGKAKVGKAGAKNKRGRVEVPGFRDNEDGTEDGPEVTPEGTPEGTPEAPTGPANAPGGPEAPVPFEEQDFHPDAEGNPNGVAMPQVNADGHVWSLKEGDGVSKDWLDNAPAGSEFTITGGKDGKQVGVFRKDVDGSWRRISGRLGHFNPRTEGIQGNMDPDHNFNIFDDDGNLTGDYASGKVNALGDASYRPLHISKSYEQILPQTKDLDAMPDGVSVIIYDPANSLRVNNVPKYAQFYKKQGKWYAVTSEGMVTEGISSDALGIEGAHLFKSSKGDDISVVPHSGEIDPGEISPRARYYSRDVFDGEFSEGAVIWRIRTDKETNTTGQRTYAYRHVGVDPDTGEDLWIGQDFTTNIPVPTRILNQSVGGEFFVDDTPRTIAQYRDRRAQAMGKRGHFLEDDDLSPLVNHYDADVPDHMDYFAGDHIKQFSQLQKYEDNAVMRVVGAPGEEDYYIKKRPDGWHRIRGLGLLEDETISLTMGSDVYKAFKDKKRGVRFESFNDYPDATDAGVNLTPDGHTASARELRDAINAIDDHQGHHFAQAVKQIPDGNILKDPETMRAVLERAKWAHPGLSDKEALSRYLRTLDKQQRKGLFERGGAKAMLGNPNGPLRPQGAAPGKVAYGEFATGDIDDAINLLENSPNANAGSILRKANSPLAVLDVGSVLKARFGPENVDGNDRLKSKNQFIQFLREERSKIEANDLFNRIAAIKAPEPEMVDWGAGPVPVAELPPVDPRNQARRAPQAPLRPEVADAQVGDSLNVDIPGFGEQRFEKISDRLWVLRGGEGEDLATIEDKDMAGVLDRADARRLRPAAPEFVQPKNVGNGALLPYNPNDEDDPYPPFDFEDWDENGYKPLASKVEAGYTVGKKLSRGNNVSGAVYQVTFTDGSLGVVKVLGSSGNLHGPPPETFEEGGDIERSREILGAAFGQLLGVPRMPGAYTRERPDGKIELFTDYKAGKVGSSSGKSQNSLVRDPNSGHREMLWFDVITGNTDRHGDNYKVQDSGLNAPIDHGLVKFGKLPGDRLYWRNKDLLEQNAAQWGPAWDAIKENWRDKIADAEEMFKKYGFNQGVIDDLMNNFEILDEARREFG